MAELTLVIVAFLAAGAGYYEAARREARDGEGPWGLDPAVCGLACVVIGFMVAVVFVPLVAGVIVGVVANVQAERYEELQRRRLAGRPARLWGVTAGLLGLVLAALVSVLAIAAVAILASLVCGLLLVRADRDQISAERSALLAEKDELLAEKRSLIAEQSKRPVTPYSNAVAAALRAEQPAAR